MPKWSKTFLEEKREDGTYISIVFTWDLPLVLERIKQFSLFDEKFIVGGPAVRLNPDYFGKHAEVRLNDGDWLTKHNSSATRTSLGCIRSCGFCAVPKTEGALIELKDWPVRPLVCDNNLLACSKKHFDNVIDKLKTLEWCDFNQGLDARLLTQHHADRFAELKNPRIRLAWDHIKTERDFMRAAIMLRKAGIPRKLVSVYVLIGYNDSPDDAIYRLETIRHVAGFSTNPMRYQPLNAKEKNCFVGENWTDRELKRYMTYWSRLRYTGGIPFDEWKSNYSANKKNDDDAILFMNNK